MGVSNNEAARLEDTYADIDATARNLSLEGTRW